MSGAMERCVKGRSSDEVRWKGDGEDEGGTTACAQERANDRSPGAISPSVSPAFHISLFHVPRSSQALSMSSTRVHHVTISTLPYSRHVLQCDVMW
jgi:hypothetical protein